MTYNFWDYHKKIKTKPTANGYNTETTVPNWLAEVYKDLGYIPDWHGVNIRAGLEGCKGEGYCKETHDL